MDDADGDRGSLIDGAGDDGGGSLLLSVGRRISEVRRINWGPSSKVRSELFLLLNHRILAIVCDSDGSTTMIHTGEQLKWKNKTNSQSIWPWNLCYQWMETTD